ncbi:MAG: formylglycine-generating enzyme family protein [Sedimenticola sp.]
MAYCGWLSAQLGYQVSLPTEWQWQQAACSGHSEWDYPWGKGYESGRANIDETWGEAGPYNLGKTTAVGLYPEGDSLQGVSDLSGNVLEWCLNEYKETADIQPSGTESRVVRGGSWLHYSGYARASFRVNINVPGYRYYNPFRM